MQKFHLILFVFLIFIFKKSNAQNAVGKEEEYAASFKNGTTKMGGVIACKKYFLIKETESEYYFLVYGYAYSGDLNGINKSILEIYNRKNMKKTKSIVLDIPRGESVIDGSSNESKMVVFTHRYKNSVRGIVMYSMNNAGKLTQIQEFKNPSNDNTSTTYHLIWSPDRKTFAVFNTTTFNASKGGFWNFYVNIFDHSFKAISKKTKEMEVHSRKQIGPIDEDFYIMTGAVSNNGAFGFVYDNNIALSLGGLTRDGQEYKYPLENIAPKNYLYFALGFNPADELMVTCVTSYKQGNKNYKKEEWGKSKMIYFWHMNVSGEMLNETKSKVSEKAEEINKYYQYANGIDGIQLICSESNIYILGQRKNVEFNTDIYGGIFCVSLSNAGEVNWAKGIAAQQSEKRIESTATERIPFGGYNYYFYNNKIYLVHNDNNQNKYNIEIPKTIKSPKNCGIFLTSISAEGDIKQNNVFDYSNLDIAMSPGQNIMDNEGYSLCVFIGDDGSAIGKFKLE